VPIAQVVPHRHHLTGEPNTLDETRPSRIRFAYHPCATDRTEICLLSTSQTSPNSEVAYLDLFAGLPDTAPTEQFIEAPAYARPTVQSIHSFSCS